MQMTVAYICINTIFFLCGWLLILCDFGYTKIVYTIYQYILIFVGWQLADSVHNFEICLYTNLCMYIHIYVCIYVYICIYINTQTKIYQRDYFFLLVQITNSGDASDKVALGSQRMLCLT